MSRPDAEAIAQIVEDITGIPPRMPRVIPDPDHPGERRIRDGIRVAPDKGNFVVISSREFTTQELYDIETAVSPLNLEVNFTFHLTSTRHDGIAEHVYRLDKQ